MVVDLSRCLPRRIRPNQSFTAAVCTHNISHSCDLQMIKIDNYFITQNSKQVNPLSGSYNYKLSAKYCRQFIAFPQGIVRNEVTEWRGGELAHKAQRQPELRGSATELRAVGKQHYSL